MCVGETLLSEHFPLSFHSLSFVSKTNEENMRFLGLLALGVAVTPVQKVIQMLNDMAAKGKQEKQDEEVKGKTCPLPLKVRDKTFHWKCLLASGGQPTTPHYPAAGNGFRKVATSRFRFRRICLPESGRHIRFLMSQ